MQVNGGVWQERLIMMYSAQCNQIEPSTNGRQVRREVVEHKESSDQ